jgi:hypothetical protein
MWWYIDDDDVNDDDDDDDDDDNDDDNDDDDDDVRFCVWKTSEPRMQLRVGPVCGRLTQADTGWQAKKQMEQ